MVNEFDYRNNRIMLSLGPLNKKKYCTFSCPFCYVHAGFDKYPNLTIPQIVAWVSNFEEKYDIIYISGDTDSFAAPRTEMGLELLFELTKFKVDLLFTTRNVFTLLQLKQIEEIFRLQTANGRYLIGCTSIAQLHHPNLEPSPIESPQMRMAQLDSFKKMGLVSIASICPIFPFIETKEYIELIDLSVDKVNIILGSDLYTDVTGIIEGKMPEMQPFTKGNFKRKMDFNTNENVWNVYVSKETKSIIKTECKRLNIPFFQRSSDALQWIRHNIII